MPKGKDTVEVKVTVGRDPVTGKAIRMSFYGKTKRIAKANADKYKRENPSGYQTVDKNITLATWANKWLEVYKKPNVTDITYHGTYERNIEKYIKPYFSDAKLNSLRAIDIQQFYTAHSHYSQSLLDKLKMILSAMYECAIDNDLAERNPARNIVPKSNKIKKEKRAYSKEESDKLTKYALSNTNKQAYLAVMLMLKAGLRIGEVLALRWEDIDLQAQTLDVNKSVAESKGGLKVGPPKTPSSAAIIPISDELQKILSSAPRSISGLVLQSAVGKEFSPDNFRHRHYNPFMKDFVSKQKEEDPNVTITPYEPHELRHTFGSLVYKATKDIFITSKLMRHSDIRETAKTYVHEGLDDKKEALEKVSQL